MQTWVLMKMSKAGSIIGAEMLWPSDLRFNYDYFNRTITNIIYFGFAQNDGNSYALAPTLDGPLMTGEL